MIYIRMRHRLQIRPDDVVYLKDIAQVIYEEKYAERINSLVIFQKNNEKDKIIIIDVMEVIEKIKQEIGWIEVQTIGPTQTIIEVVYEKKKVSFPLFILVWFLLFFGSGLAIMYFHEDVSMRETQQRLYTIMTGKEAEKPLIFQIPYSIGLGLGMILFFN